MADVMTEKPARAGIDRTKLFAYLMVAPVVLLIVGLVGYPFFFAIYVAFTDRVIGSVGNWIGFRNFQYLAGTSAFNQAICYVDPQGAVITGAAVTVINRQTNASQRTTSDSEGRWIISGVPSGPVRVRVEASGFKSFEQEMEAIRGIL
mgnify:CR=1 FL=1